MIVSLRCVATAGALAGLTIGCGFVGFKYSYGGHEYTMTVENRDYHQAAIRDVRGRFGDLRSEEDAAKLKGACELLQKYSAAAPDPGSFTSARDLLDGESGVVCHRWREREAIARATAEQEHRQEEWRQEREMRERQREADKRAEERQRVTSALERDDRLIATCDSTDAARAARKRRAGILERGAGLEIRKSCAPRVGTQTVSSTCKDANGFTRACTKAVSTGEIVGYTCPKSMDAETVQLGLYQLDLLESYPFPEDRSIRVRDEDCDEARARVAKGRAKLDELTKVTP